MYVHQKKLYFNLWGCQGDNIFFGLMSKIIDCLLWIFCLSEITDRLISEWFIYEIENVRLEIFFGVDIHFSLLVIDYIFFYIVMWMSERKTVVCYPITEYRGLFFKFVSNSVLHLTWRAPEIMKLLYSVDPFRVKNKSVTHINHPLMNEQWTK